MPESIRDFAFVEEPVPAPVRIGLHVPKSGKLPEDHPYFQKGIRWVFIREGDLSGTHQPEFYGSGIPPAQEIHIRCLQAIAGFPVAEIGRRMTQCDRLTTAFTPASGDWMFMSEYFVHEHIRTAPKRDREFSPGVDLAVFRFAAEQWLPLTDLSQQPDLRTYVGRFLGATSREQLLDRSGILRWR